MSSQIDNQPVTIQRLIIPEGTGLHNNVNASLPPLQGSIAYDRSGNPGTIYSGTGLSWLAAAQGGDAIGPSVSNNNDLVAFDGLTGKLLKDSAIPSADVVQATTTSVSGNLVAYNGTGGRAIQDSNILATNVVQGPASAVNNNLCAFDLTTGKLIKDSGVAISSLIAGSSTTITGITLTSVGGTNPNFVNCSLYLQKITLGSFSMVIFSLNILQAVAAAGTGDTWVSAAGTIPAGYVPANELYFPASLFSAAIGGKANYGLLDIQADGTITVLSFAAAGVVNFQSLQTTYNV